MASLLLACGPNQSVQNSSDVRSPAERRVPAEWEPQSAIWLQWPAEWEGSHVEAAFVNIVSVLIQYETVQLVVNTETHRTKAKEALAALDQDNINFHIIPINSSWMRDNGPRYILEEDELILQDWGFNAWNLPDSPFEKDNAVPEAISEILKLPFETVPLIHERGDLESNGKDTVMVSWTVLSDRNPEMNKADITAHLTNATGADSVIYVEGHDPLDITLGHVDGMARFVSEDTVIVGQDGSNLMDNVALQIAEQRPDIEVQRLVSENASMLMNWLVGDGFILIGDSQNQADNDAASRLLNTHFPDRTVHFVNVNALWMNGGGVHCVTNDQPE